MLACALLCVSIASAPLPGPSEDGLAAVRAVLRRSEGATPARDEVLCRRLVALGPGAARALFSLATGEGIEACLVDDDPAAWMCPPDHVGELALSALAELPALPVRELLRAESRARPTREVRTAALDVIGRQGSAEGLELYFELLAESGVELAHPSVRSTALNALVAMLRRDSESARRLEKPLLASPLPAQELACEALARCNRAPSVALLTRLFGRDPELDRAALEALTCLGEQYPWRLGEDVTTRLRGVLERDQTALRAPAAQALGRVRCAQAVPALIALLTDEDPTVRRAAQWSLREISGEKRWTEPSEWLRWFEAEHAWWQEEGKLWLERIDPSDPARLAETLRALIAHPLGREQVADTLAGALSDFEPAAQAVLCGALARLGSRRAVPALVELLYDRTPELRAAAWEALRALTGEDLPAEPQLWEAYAFD